MNNPSIVMLYADGTKRDVVLDYPLSRSQLKHPVTSKLPIQFIVPKKQVKEFSSTATYLRLAAVASKEKQVIIYAD